MSKAIYICTKNRLDIKQYKSKLEKICTELTPDHISPNNNHKQFVDDYIAYAITLESGISKSRNKSLMLGAIFENESIYWEKPKEAYPNGNYAIFRSSDDDIEIVSDALGSRTIWYYHDDEIFIASTSQRAIILFLGDFVFERQVIPWMLSTGTIGPEKSYDQRIKRLRPDSSITLNRNDWTISESDNLLQLTPSSKDKNDLKSELENSIRSIIKHLNQLDLNDWLLPLSGGYDSRGLLYYLIKELKLSQNLKTITWGLQEANSEEMNDAFVARKLAKKFNLSNQFISTDSTSATFNEVVDRFLECGEGRVDQINAYIDGMEIWKKLYKEGCRGIIRGDMVFGCPEALFDKQARFYNALALCSDYSNLSMLQKKFNLPEQALPEHLKKRATENSQQYMYRLHSSNKVGTLLAGLSDVKLSYIEQVTPFLSKKIAESVRKQPDDIRKNKALFKEIVNSKITDVPIATKSATASLDEILSREKVVNEITKVLNGRNSKEIFTKDLINFVLSKLKNGNENKTNYKKLIKNFIAKILPDFLLVKAEKIQKSVGSDAIKPDLEYKFVAFRLFLIVKMVDLLKEDSKKI